MHVCATQVVLALGCDQLSKWMQQFADAVLTELRAVLGDEGRHCFGGGHFCVLGTHDVDFKVNWDFYVLVHDPRRLARHVGRVYRGGVCVPCGC